jgi:hypothetical protein
MNNDIGVGWEGVTLKSSFVIISEMIEKLRREGIGKFMFLLQG